MDATDWANRFVPLPPTEFPPEATGLGGHQGLANDNGQALGLPIAETNLPCLQALAGVDPFFTPADTSSTAAALVASASSPLMSSAPPLALCHPPVSKNGNNNLDHECDNSLRSPSVEVIGQQTEPAPTVKEKNLAAEATLQEKNLEVENMNESYSDQQTIDIHEYDLALKVLPNVSAAVAAEQSNERVEVAASEAADHDAADYWSQGNVSSFVPGVTPIGAYPVCREFAEQLLEAGDARLASAGSDGREEVSEPVQADPFESDSFESVHQVTPTGAGNQWLQVAPRGSSNNQPANAPVAPSVVEANSEVAVETAGTTETSVDSNAMEESPLYGEPQNESRSEASQSVVAPLDVTKAIPQLPSSGIASRSPSSQQLFESVEQSLSDLQSINQAGSQGAFALATNVFAESPVQPEAAIEAAVERPAQVAWPVVVAALENAGLAVKAEPVSAKMASGSVEPGGSSPASQALEFSAFEPVDLTVQLPAVPAATAPAQVAVPIEAETQSMVEGRSPIANSVSAKSPVAEKAPFESAAKAHCQVIQVDGNDGYDFLDLKAFDASNAIFTPGIIFLDDGVNKFQVEYRNLSVAVFANDFQVELS